MMEEKQFEILTKKLDTLAKLFAFNIIDGKAVNEQVDILDKAGFRPTEIADILDKDPNQIYVTMSLLRKAKKKTSKKEDPLKKQEIPREESSQ